MPRPIPWSSTRRCCPAAPRSSTRPWHTACALAAFAAGDPAGALHLERADWEAIESSFESEAGDRFLRARVLEALGRDQESLSWYRTIAQRAMHELVYLAPSRLREAMITCRLGDMAGAATAHAAAVRLWRDAAPPQRDRVSEIGQQLRQLGVTLASVGDTSR
jgi:hypothetical protein